MKRIFTLLWLTLTAFTFKATAQSTTCNAEFSVQYISNNTVKFNPVITEGAPFVQHFWNFADGSPVSLLVSPTHTYALPGTYAVVHTIVRINQNQVPVCTQSFTKLVTILPECNLVVNFSWSSTASNPLTIAFQNLSVPLAATDSIFWHFGDNTTSNAVNPVHTYANAGTYNVCLIVKKFPYSTNIPCIRYICKTVVVYPPCNLVADFNWTVTATNPLRIEFHNLSVPLSTTDSIRWTFGDGSSSTVVNPVHTYNVPGTYTVCLRVKKVTTAGSAPCVREICKTIVIPPACNFQVNFSWRLDSLNHRKVYFTNLTTPPTAGATATWHFGDGTSATSWNAIHEYAQPGRYIVCLKIQISNTCIREKCDTIYIPHPIPPCTELSKFHFERFSNDYQKYTFTPDYINTTLQYTWTFGDGTGSHDPVAIHRYAQPGVYVACLTVWRSSTCASTTCKEIRVQAQINCDSVHVSYVYQADPQVPNKIHFYANSNIPILDQTWTITRLPAGTTITLHQNNPTYLFHDTGYYRVCLRAITLGGCIKEFCRIIHIEHIANLCELQAYPNPTSTLINVNVTLSQPEMIHAYVYNSINVLVREKHQQGVTGNNLVTINVLELPAGLYTIKLIYGNKTCYARFQKL